MPDFKLFQIQAIMFTPTANYHGGRFLNYFLTKWGHLFGGEPETHEPPPINLPVIEVARAILKSADDQANLIVSNQRLTFTRTAGSGVGIDVGDHFRTAIGLFADYLEQMEATSGRVAAILRRIAHDEDAARTLSRHFCRDRWVKGPMNRPSEFEIHSLKNYRMAGRIDVNSWFRCKTGRLVAGVPTGAVVQYRGIMVEQDLNTRPEGADTRELSLDFMRDFFTLAPNELNATLELYFPSQGGEHDEDKGQQ